MTENTKPVRNAIVKKTMTYVANPTFNERQLVALVAKTPTHFVKTRKGRGGKEFRYVTGAYVQDRLNQVFGWGWSFEVKDHGKSPSNRSVWVLGRLTVLDPQTKQVLVTKEQFGSADIKVEKGTTIEVDYADDMKAASTDALKKCASLLGVAADIYSDPTTANEIEQRAAAVVQYHRDQKASKAQEVINYPAEEVQGDGAINN
jgi:recombination DNA repair RAD52 pathway protein